MELDVFNDIPGYHYLRGLSTVGIIYNNDDNELSPDFFEFYPFLDAAAAEGLLLPQPVGAVPEHFTACYSADGMLAVRDTVTNRYFVGNPFAPAPHNYTALPPTPRPHHVDNTHVVVTMNMVAPSIFHLICAVRRNPGFYDLDVYYSAYHSWYSREDIDLGGREIVHNSGVSCGRHAHWLTTATKEKPRSIFRFDPFILYDEKASDDKKLFYIEDGGKTFWPLKLWDDVDLEHQETKIQLGSIWRALYVAVVNMAVDVPRVDLHYVDNGNMTRIAFLFLAISQDVNWDTVTSQWIEDNVLECPETPRLVRFQSYKMEVPLWVDGRVVVWQKNSNHLEVHRTVLLPESAGVRVADGFAHVRTDLMPGNFHVFRHQIPQPPKDVLVNYYEVVDNGDHQQEDDA